MKPMRLLAVAAVGTLMLATGGVAGAANPKDGLGVSGTALAPDQVGYSKNMKHMSNTPHVGPFAGQFGTDLAFQGKYAYAGNYDGFLIYDICNPKAPRTVAQVLCPGSQNDISRLAATCSSCRPTPRAATTAARARRQPATEKSSWEGIKIFDISDKTAPEVRQAAVETACGSHTHTLVPERRNVYLYVSSYSPSAAFPDCQPPHDGISVIKVPATPPDRPPVVALPGPLPRRRQPRRHQPGRLQDHRLPRHHRLPEQELAAGACMGDGILFDITGPGDAQGHRPGPGQRELRVLALGDLQPEGEQGRLHRRARRRRRGHLQRRRSARTAAPTASTTCQGDNAAGLQAYFKIPRQQADTENCVAHNGSIIPVKGRDVMVQAWYQGGVSVWDFTDSSKPKEIGYFERGPLAPTSLGRPWSAYYYNGYIYSNDIAEGLRRPEAQRPDAAQGQLGQARRVQRPDAAGLPHQVT